jgi:hypothetical protein
MVMFEACEVMVSIAGKTLRTAQVVSWEKKL